MLGTSFGYIDLFDFFARTSRGIDGGVSASSGEHSWFTVRELGLVETPQARIESASGPNRLRPPALGAKDLGITSADSRRFG